MSSKVWVVRANKNATEVKKLLAYEYDPTADSRPDNYLENIGLVYDHNDDDAKLHIQGTPARRHFCSPVISSVEVSNLEGRLLTLVDASIGDKEQRKAFKDLLTQALWRWEDELEQRATQCFEGVR